MVATFVFGSHPILTVWLKHALTFCPNIPHLGVNVSGSKKVAENVNAFVELVSCVQFAGAPKKLVPLIKFELLPLLLEA